jgi:hypothetical protein
MTQLQILICAQLEMMLPSKKSQKNMVLIAQRWGKGASA